MPDDHRPRRRRRETCVLDVVRPGMSISTDAPVTIPHEHTGPVRYDRSSLDRPTVQRRAIEVETRANPLDLERAVATLVNHALSAAGLTDDQGRAVDVRSYLADGGHVVTVQIVTPIDHEQAARIVASVPPR